jgi:parallel beta-helix repeat protein
MIINVISPVLADPYPGGYIQLSGTQSLTIDQNFVLDNNIELKDFAILTIQNCQINCSLTNTIRVYDNAKIILENVTVLGKSTTAQFTIIVNSGIVKINNSQFIALQGRILESNVAVNVTNSIFSNCETAIFLNGAHFSTIENNQFSSCQKPVDTPPGTNIYIIDLINNTVQNCVRGFILPHIEQANISYNNFSRLDSIAIEITGSISDTTIDFNTISNVDTGLIVSGLYYSNIRNNTINGFQTYGLYLGRATGSDVKGNMIQSSRGKAIVLSAQHETVNSYFEQNKISFSGGLNNYMQAISEITLLEDNFVPFRIDNESVINNLPIRTYYNLQSMNLDLMGEIFSKVVLVTCTDVQISNFTVTQGDGISILNSSNCVLSNFNSSGNYYGGVLLSDCDNVLVANGTITANRYNGVHSSFFSKYNNNSRIRNSSVINCTIRENIWDGISFTAATNCTLSDLIIDNNKDIGVIFEDCLNSTIENSEINQNLWGGVWLTTNSSSTVISNNKFIQNQQRNLRLDSYSYYSFITSNEFVRSTAVGIHLNLVVDTQSCTILSNEYSDYYGFDLNSDGFGDQSYICNGSAQIADILPLFIDNDSDGLSSISEIYLYGTNPENPDTDFDLLTDFEELFPLLAFAGQLGVYSFSLRSTNPFINDTDGDGLSDFDELNGTSGYRTDPTNIDTDWDNFNDILELELGTSPIDDQDWPGRQYQNDTIIDALDEEPIPEVQPQRSVKSINGVPFELFGCLCWLTTIGGIFYLKKRRMN